MRASWWWIDRWRSSPAYTGMTLAEQGAYRNLLDELWIRDGVLPKDDRVLARACGDPSEWEAVRAVVMAQFTESPDGYRNATHDEVAGESKRRAAKQKSYRDRRVTGGVTSNVAPNVTHSPSPSPSPDQEPEQSQELRSFLFDVETTPGQSPEAVPIVRRQAPGKLSANPAVAAVQARWRDGPGKGIELPATPKHGGWAGFSRSLSDCLGAKGVDDANRPAAIDRVMAAFLACREDWVVHAGWPLHMLTGNWERWWNTDHEARPAGMPLDRTKAAIQEAARIMGMNDGPEDRARAGGPIRDADGFQLRRFATGSGGHRD